MTWVVAILALSLLIVIHELGHYLCARATGMHVDRFSVLGIGPVILRLGYWRGTEFVISAIPFGAYVHIVGMEPEEESDRPPPGVGPNAAVGRDYAPFRDRPVWARLLVISGGPLANYLTAIVVCVGLFTAAGIKTPTAVSIADFDGRSPAQAAGLLQGDVFVSVAGQDVTGASAASLLNQATSAHLGQTVDVTVRRAGELLTVPVTLNAQAPALQTTLAPVGEWIPVAPGEAFARGVRWPFEKTAENVAALGMMVWQLFTRGESDGRVGGPVAIARAIKTSADSGPLDLLIIVALISTALGFFNLLPLPALDGGRLAFMAYEIVAGRPVNPRVEGWVHGLGMLALLGLIGWATVGDLRVGKDTAVWQPAAAKLRAGLAREAPGDPPRSD